MSASSSAEAISSDFYRCAARFEHVAEGRQLAPKIHDLINWLSVTPDLWKTRCTIPKKTSRFSPRCRMRAVALYHWPSTRSLRDRFRSLDAQLPVNVTMSSKKACLKTSQNGADPNDARNCLRI